MRIKIVRESGRPVELDKIEEFETERKEIFDKAQIEHDKRCSEGIDFNESMSCFQSALSLGDEKLSEKYDTISEMEYPKSAKQARVFVEKYGSYLVSTHRDTGELMFVIMDMGM